jgi:hypothetical protein
MSILFLNKAKKNKIIFSYEANLTGLTVRFRIKSQVEDMSTPIFETTGTVTTYGATSSGYINVDLTGAKSSLSGVYVYEIQIDNNTGTDIPVFSVIGTLQIQTRLALNA